MSNSQDGANRNWLSPGTHLNDTYEIEQGIASGGMGEIYRGHNIQTGDPVAIKMIRSDVAETESAMAMFRKEASALNKLYHEAIVRYYGFSVDPTLKRPYMAMEFVSGRSLSDMVKSGPLAFVDVCILGMRVASGLQVAHERGIIHRDISPDNIIIPEDAVAEAKIIDFGIARQTKSSEGTIVGDGLAGKYNYMSPEQLGLNGGDVRAVSDIYSFGLVLVEAATARPLNMRGNPVELIEKRRKVPDLDHVPGRLRPLIEAMLQPDPADRPQSMRDVAEWLNACLDRSFGGSLGNPEENRTVVSPMPRPGSTSSRPASGTGFGTGLGTGSGPRPGFGTGFGTGLGPGTGRPPGDGRAPPRPETRSGGDRPVTRSASQPPPSEPPRSRFPGSGDRPEDRSGTGAASLDDILNTHAGPARDRSSLRETGGETVVARPGGGTLGRGAGRPVSVFEAPVREVSSARDLSPSTGPAMPEPDLASRSRSPRDPIGGPVSQPPTPNRQPPPETPKAAKSGAPILPIAAGVAALLAVGGGAWFALSGKPSTPSTPTVVAEKPATPSQAPFGKGEPPPAANPPAEVRTEVAAAELGRFLADYPGGDCFFLDPVVLSPDRVVTEGFGRSIVPFEGFDEAFRARHGFEADIRLNQVTNAQCPIVELLKRTRRTGRLDAHIEMLQNRVKVGAMMAGAVGGPSGSFVSVVVVGADGTARVVAPNRPAEAAAQPFVTAATGDPTARGGRPDVIVALATDRKLPTLADDRPVPVGAFVEALDRDLQTARAEVATAARYVVVER